MRIKTLLSEISLTHVSTLIGINKMALIENSTLLYEEAKACKRGKSQTAVFESLKTWIKASFGFEVVCIQIETVERPRLHIWLEKQEDCDWFYHEFEDSKLISYQIAEKYKMLVNEEPSNTHWLQRIKLYYTVIPKPEPLKNLYCFYSCFSQKAIKESCSKVPSHDIEALIYKYKKDKVWEIHIYDNYAYVFVYIHSDIEEVKSSIENELKGQWYEMLKSHDEFGYIDLNTINIIFDSKENFDTNYQGQWHYYYK